MRARGVGLMAALAVVVLSAPAVAAALSPSVFSDPGATPEQAVRAQTGSPKGLEPPVRHAQGGAPQDADEDELPFRYIQGIGDLNQDRVRDSLVVVQGLADASVRLEARAGTDGKLLWERDLGTFLDILPRAGDPNPSPWPVAQAMPDIDGDGVDDVLAQELRMESSLPPLPTSVVGAIAAPTWIHALSGRTGEPVWSQPVVGSIAWEWIDPRLLSYQDILTGWRHWMSDDGPRLLYKATDVTLINVVDPTCVYSCLLGVQAQDVQVSETLVLLDVAAGGRMIWSRDVSFLEDPEHTAFSWITGVVDVTGDQVADVIVDQELRHRPQFTELWEGVTGQPIYNYGRGMRVRAFDGSDGSDLWSNLVYDEDAVRVNTHTEERYPVLLWTHGQILGDTTGDGADEVMALYLIRDAGAPTTPNGRHVTHFVLLSGADGSRLWEERQQGWGYADVLGARASEGVQVALGTLDVPTPNPPMGQFPPKDVRLTVVDGATGEPRWGFMERFPQDNYLPYELTLMQYAAALAPFDWDGDGLKDLVTPARYDRPVGSNQTLVSTAEHSYLILSGHDGVPLKRVEVRGPLGLVVPCGTTSGDFTVVAGHARRVDVIRVNLTSDAVSWQHPFFFDERRRSAIAGIDLVLLGVACTSDDGRDLVSVNLLTQSIGRGPGGVVTETHAASGIVGSQGALRWVLPAVQEGVPTVPVLATTPVRASASWTTQDSLLVAAGVLPSAVIGIGLGAWRRRRIAA